MYLKSGQEKMYIDCITQWVKTKERIKAKIESELAAKAGLDADVLKKSKELHGKDPEFTKEIEEFIKNLLLQTIKGRLVIEDDACADAIKRFEVEMLIDRKLPVDMPIHLRAYIQKCRALDELKLHLKVDW